MIIGGKKLVKILKNLKNLAKPGINLLQIERKAWELMQREGGNPSFLSVNGYSHATCLNVNDGLVHGIPRDYILKEADLLNIDMGFFYKGYHTDLAQSLIVSYSPENYPEKVKFLKAGINALNKAIRISFEGNFVGSISAKIQENIEKSGFAAASNYTGHGIGKNLHEAPLIPCILNSNINATPPLKSGMTLAIEVIYMMGRSNTIIESDNWTVRTADRSLAACFEKTIVVGKRNPLILTDWD